MGIDRGVAAPLLRGEREGGFNHSKIVVGGCHKPCSKAPLQIKRVVGVRRVGDAWFSRCVGGSNGALLGRAALRSAQGC